MAVPSIAGSSCAIAVSFYKVVSERGVWGDDLLNDAELAWNMGTERASEMAMLRWWIAAERGFEVAQNNLAYVLDQGVSPLLLVTWVLPSKANRSQTRASCALQDSRPYPLRTTRHASR